MNTNDFMPDSYSPFEEIEKIKLEVKFAIATNLKSGKSSLFSDGPYDNLMECLKIIPVYNNSVIFKLGAGNPIPLYEWHNDVWLRYELLCESK